ncbi:P19 protein [Tetterwort vein chlorosis virus]|uniref:p19 protein n=1 Tax=Tetterwort vein chlorosis virus TaxID=1712389 RepID=A0A0M4M752_9CLOS|nr:P19 protein [Tetterwort vein chlorosis virus]ALE18215.1 P19 protein [Tetterwort vein chlorosis virus]
MAEIKHIIDGVYDLVKAFLNNGTFIENYYSIINYASAVEDFLSKSKKVKIADVPMLKTGFRVCRDNGLPTDFLKNLFVKEYNREFLLHDVKLYKVMCHIVYKMLCDDDFFMFLSDFYSDGEVFCVLQDWTTGLTIRYNESNGHLNLVNEEFLTEPFKIFNDMI